MERNIQSISLNLIRLDLENVRFGGDSAQNQREALELLMADPDDARKLLKLAEHIAKYGLDPTELQLVTPTTDGAFIVLEGNRRLAALKLLQKPDLCPDKKIQKSFFGAQVNLAVPVPEAIQCSVVASRAEGDMWIELKHTGQNAGVGRVPWDSDIRDERRARQTGVESVGRQIRTMIKDNSDSFSSHAISDIHAIPVTTLTRLFSSKPAQEIFRLAVRNRELCPEVELEKIAPALEFAISLFREEGYNVNDVRSDEDRKRFLALIPAEIRPENISSKSESLGKDRSEGQSFVSTGSDTGDETGREAGGDKKSDGHEISSKSSSVRAKPSSRARKYLISWSLKIPNARVNEIYRELRSKLVVENVPNAASVLFRVFVEISCDEIIKRAKDGGGFVPRSDNKKALTDGDKLAIKVQSVAAFLADNDLIAKQESKLISKRAGSSEIIGSIDHFNQFVHSSAAAPIPSELKDVADDYKPFFEAIWR